MVISETPTLHEPSADDPQVVAAESEQDICTRSPDSSETAPTQVNELAEASPVSWEGPHDPKNPQNWSTSKKWLVMSVNAAVTVNMCVLWVCSPRLPANG